MSVAQTPLIENPTTAIAAAKMLVGSTTTLRLAMRGTSMLPLLREPMVLELGPIDQGIRVGDIIVFEREEKLVAHRVMAIQHGAIQTCGDARPWEPEYPDTQAIIGKVNAVYASDSVDAKRVDTPHFRMRGELYARTRKVRAVIFWPTLLGRRCVKALPWRRQRSYTALVDAMAAVVQEDRTRFELAISKVAPEDLAAVARRHGCSPALVEAIFSFHTTSEAADCLRRAMQPLGRAAAVRAFAMREQLRSLVRVLTGKSVPFALLKGASRIYQDEPAAALHASSDIDILVPHASLESAIDALHAQGYDERNFAAIRDRYRERHHHAAPLFPPEKGFAIELHTALAPPGRLSTPLHWNALQNRMVAHQGATGLVCCLDTVGTALHLATHSIGLFRLRDSVLLAQLLIKMSDEQLTVLKHIAAEERTDPLRLNASLAMSAHIAGITWPKSADVERYLLWSTKREDIPLFLATRSPLAEGWYAGGRRFTPLSWRLLNPTLGDKLDARLLPAVIGRSITSVVAYAYGRAMRS